MPILHQQAVLANATRIVALSEEVHSLPPFEAAERVEQEPEHDAEGQEVDQQEGHRQPGTATPSVISIASRSWTPGSGPTAASPITTSS